MLRVGFWEFRFGGRGVGGGGQENEEGVVDGQG